LRNRAEIVLAEFMTVRQVPVPLHGLPHPTNEWPVAGTAVRVTATPWLKSALQLPDGDPAVNVQLIPDGLDLTAPVPVPRPEMVSR
jgi:hypothetical protein